MVACGYTMTPWLTVTGNVMSDTSVDAASGDGLNRGALPRRGATAARMPQKFWAPWGPFLPREWAGPPPHHRSGARGLRVIGKVTAKSRMGNVRGVVRPCANNAPTNINDAETCTLAKCRSSQCP